jgi:hypothetical protein
MAARFHRPLKVIAFNKNGIWRRRCELTKQLQDLHIDVVLLSETHLKRHERFFIPNYHFYQTGGFPEGSLFTRDKPIFSSERMLHKDYGSKGLVEKNLWS